MNLEDEFLHVTGRLCNNQGHVVAQSPIPVHIYLNKSKVYAIVGGTVTMVDTGIILHAGGHSYTELKLVTEKSK